MKEELEEFLSAVNECCDNETLHKITLSKVRSKSVTLINVYIRTVEIKNERMLSFTYRHKTNDQTKNYTLEAGIQEIVALLNTHFLSAILISTNFEITLLGSTKGNFRFLRKDRILNQPVDLSHNREKVKRSEGKDKYLQILGIANDKGDIIPSMADKFRQINKYLEIIESQLKGVTLPEKIHIVDMGSGKGYLTFALYNYLKYNNGLDVTIVGIELRKDLVDFCNSAAKTCGFDQLNFVCERIENYQAPQIDILIALHACDTATDDALYRAIISKASLIVCAPCCHKQIRQQVKGKEQKNAMLKYGIFKERHFEMVTDTLRALILEKNQYETNIFEFVSNEHTRKNIMLVASKAEKKSSNLELINQKIDSIKSEYFIEYQYLEKLLS